MEITREQFDIILNNKRGRASSELLNLLSPLLDLPSDCTGITLTINIREEPQLEVRRVLIGERSQKPNHVAIKERPTQNV